MQNPRKDHRINPSERKTYIHTKSLPNIKPDQVKILRVYCAYRRTDCEPGRLQTERVRKLRGMSLQNGLQSENEKVSNFYND